MHSRSLCYSLRSDEKASSWYLGRVSSWTLLGLLLAAWTLGASGELLEVALGLLSGLKSLRRRLVFFERFSGVLEHFWRLLGGSRPGRLRKLHVLILD